MEAESKEVKEEDQTNLVFPLTSTSGGSAAASFNFQLPPPPPPGQGKQAEPIYATPTTGNTSIEMQ